MSYQQEIAYQDYQIAFEYEYDGDNLNLISWVAYLNDNEFHLPCVVESQFIESQLHKWLDNEWNKNNFNYIEERQITRTMKKCEF